VLYVKRFAVLYSDPILGFFTDESAAEPKGSRSAAGATATHDGDLVVEIAVPNEKSIKLRTSTVEEAQAWTAKINLVCSTTVPLAPGKGNTGAWQQRSTTEPLSPEKGKTGAGQQRSTTAPLAPEKGNTGAGLQHASSAKRVVEHTVPVSLEAPVMTPRNQEPAPEAHGKRLHAGMVEQEKKTAVSVLYVKRFAVLYSDPILGFYTDESFFTGGGGEPKGSRSVAGATATHDGDLVVEIAVPNEKSIKLRTSTVEEAQAWTAKINLVCSTTAPLAPGKGSTGAWQQHRSTSSVVT